MYEAKPSANRVNIIANVSSFALWAREFRTNTQIPCVPGWRGASKENTFARPLALGAWLTVHIHA